MKKAVLKKGVSAEAQALTRKYRERFVEFVQSKGIAEVSKRTGCNYQALRNSVAEGYNPSPDTVFQVKLGYGDDFDEVYIFTGKKMNGGEPTNQSAVENTPVLAQSDSYLKETMSLLQEKISERERLINDLKRDKRFLQNMIKSLSVSDSSKTLESVLNKFKEALLDKLVYAYKPEKYDPKITLVVVEGATDIIDNFRNRLRSLVGQMDTTDYSTIMSLTNSESALYKLAEYDFDVESLVLAKVSERDPLDDGEEDPTTKGQYEADDIIEDAKLSLLELHGIINELI